MSDFEQCSNQFQLDLTSLLINFSYELGQVMTTSLLNIHYLSIVRFTIRSLRTPMHRNSRNIIHPRNTLVNLNTIESGFYLILQTRLLLSRIIAQLPDSTCHRKRPPPVRQQFPKYIHQSYDRYTIPPPQHKCAKKKERSNKTPNRTYGSTPQKQGGQPEKTLTTRIYSSDHPYDI